MVFMYTSSNDHSPNEAFSLARENDHARQASAHNISSTCHENLLCYADG
jgi:hypothetical protein